MTEAEWLAATDPVPLLEFVLGNPPARAGAWFSRLARRPGSRPAAGASDRKLRLFACACARQVCRVILWWDHPVVGAYAYGLADHAPLRRARSAVEVAERFADGLADRAQLATAAQVLADVLGLLRQRLGAFPPGKDALEGFIQGIRVAAATTEQDARVAARRAGRDADWPAWGHLAFEEWEHRGPANAGLRGEVCLLQELFGNPFRAASCAAAWLAWNDGTVPKLAEIAYELRSEPEATLERRRLAVLADALEDAGCTDAELLGHLRGPGPHVRGCWALDLVTGKS